MVYVRYANNFRGIILKERQSKQLDLEELSVVKLCWGNYSRLYSKSKGCDVGEDHNRFIPGNK